MAGIASLLVGAASWLLAILTLNGTFHGNRCGEYGGTCISAAFVVLAAGLVIGLVTAVVALATPQRRRWIGWLGLAVNGLPAAGLLVISLLVMSR